MALANQKIWSRGNGWDEAKLREEQAGGGGGYRKEKDVNCGSKVYICRGYVQKILAHHVAEAVVLGAASVGA